MFDSLTDLQSSQTGVVDRTSAQSLIPLLIYKALKRPRSGGSKTPGLIPLLIYKALKPFCR